VKSSVLASYVLPLQLLMLVLGVASTAYSFSYVFETERRFGEQELIFAFVLTIVKASLATYFLLRICVRLRTLSFSHVLQYLHSQASQSRDGRWSELRQARTAFLAMAVCDILMTVCDVRGES
jgi:hypothetical protein